LTVHFRIVGIHPVTTVCYAVRKCMSPPKVSNGQQGSHFVSLMVSEPSPE